MTFCCCRAGPRALKSRERVRRGTAGVIAAVQSARANCKTLLIEKNGLPGGTMTASAIAFPGLFYAWRKQIISGIGWEIVS